MDRIDEAFATAVVESAVDGTTRPLSLPMRYALAVGKRMMNKYYALSDDSYIYRIAMSTFPFTHPFSFSDIY